ncbi:MAG: riboflavin biosynthesis protein RibF [Muribaculum sp.]|nr:riboflavin biosynthesis protein RibF [Muribaculum sp.]
MENIQPSAATVGTFDGFHRGHRAVVETLRAEAVARCLEPIVISFDRHPLATVAPERAPKLLMSPAASRRLISSAGVRTVMMEFDKKAASMTAAEFMTLLRDELMVRLMVIGYDNTFGCDGLDMKVSDYMALGKSLGIEMLEAPLETGISSSAIRKAVGSGYVEKAAGMLGRPYSIEGIVVHGEQIGRTLGYPTANLQPDYCYQLPASGVYLAEAVFPGGERHPAVANVGMRPTFANTDRPQVEAHLLDFEGDIYGRAMTLRFLMRLRDERKFADTEALKHAIACDEARARSLYQTI